MIYLKQLCSLLVVLAILTACAATNTPANSASSTPVSSPTALPTNTPTPVSEAQTAASPNETSTPVATSVAVENPMPVLTSDSATVYTNVSGGFSLDLPEQTAVYESVQPSVDGVYYAEPNSVALIRANYAISIYWHPREGRSLASYISEESPCSLLEGQPSEEINVNGFEARRDVNAICGPTSTAATYLVTADQGVTFVVRHSVPYQNISEQVETLINSFSLNE